MKKAFLFFFLCSFFLISHAQPPKLTIVFIIDQFAYHYLEKITPNLSGGIRFLLDNGVLYNNAYVPHSVPATSPGHVGINTGTFPKTHGIIGNKLINQQNDAFRYEDISIPKKDCSVFSKNGLSTISKSAHAILVDGISDQFVLASKNNHAYSLSYKSRAAIGMAGKLGKAIWFDDETRQFTSSKAYFEKLPKWLTSFNQKISVPKTPENILWKSFFTNNPQAYNITSNNTYKYTVPGTGLINKSFKGIVFSDKSEYKEAFRMTPHANQLLLDLAKEYLENNLSPKTNNILLWISLSPLDPLGHTFGPHSKETFDLLYHLDWQLQQFIEYIYEKIDNNKVLFTLTADHGVMPIIEKLQEKNFSTAQRIDRNALIKKMNTLIEKKYNIKDVVLTFRNGTFYFHKKYFYTLPARNRIKILHSLKKFLLTQPGIERIWTRKKIEKKYFEPDSIDSYFKNQYHPERSGELMCKLLPYCAITKHPKGTHHKTPYEYDTHVPLILYQKNTLEKKHINEKVLVLQLANTLAEILHVQKPSASTLASLPTA